MDPIGNLSSLETGVVVLRVLPGKSQINFRQVVRRHEARKSALRVSGLQSRAGLLKRSPFCNQFKHVALSTPKSSWSCHHLQVAMFRCIMLGPLLLVTTFSGKGSPVCAWPSRAGGLLFIRLGLSFLHSCLLGVPSFLVNWILPGPRACSLCPTFRRSEI